ncbi:transposase family protein [bacterium]|nr:transposase family protein [bacterium]
MNYLKQIYQRYHKSSINEKTKILDEFCKVCGYVRKYGIRKLNDVFPDDKDPKPKKLKNRKKKYLNQTISILEILMESTNYLCSVRLKAAIPLWLPHMKKRFPLTPEIEKQLLAISPSTIERSLKNKKRKLKRKIYGTTKPGYLLKHQIPIKTDSWNVHEPGFAEIDLVSHSGDKADGDFIYSCNFTDIKTTWTETRAIMGKGQFATQQALTSIESSLPFKLLGIDSDNGSEFINYHLYKYCQDNKIQFTRSRPYKKDDNAHIEQKNWTHVRKIFGYVRYDSEQALEAMNDLYRNELRIMQNLFLPSQKLIKKKRIGSKYIRVYDKPQTPLQRVLNCKLNNIDKNKIKELVALSNSINPFDLAKIIDVKINKIYRLASLTRRQKNSLKQVA